MTENRETVQRDRAPKNLWETLEKLWFSLLPWRADRPSLLTDARRDRDPEQTKLLTRLGVKDVRSKLFPTEPVLLPFQ